MERLQKVSLILSLMENLKEKGSWCGETHIQKAVYFLQELFTVPFEFDYILYKHGPYSFDLSSELTAIKADGLIKLVPQFPFGPSILPSDNSKHLKSLFKKTINRYIDKIEFVAKKFGDKGVKDLEKLATALYVTCENDAGNEVDARAKRIINLKPHVSEQEALKAIEMIDDIIAEVKNS